jgi:hypothetical protein
MFACALTIFHTCGTESARTRSPLHDWSLFKNSHNRRRAINLLQELNEERQFLGKNETVEIFFRTYNYGGAAMTLRNNANKCGFWEDGATINTTVIGGVHKDIKFHFFRCGFYWKDP